MYEHNGINRIRDEVDDQVDDEDQDDEVHQRHQ
jgi:hypothetical protein